MQAKYCPNITKPIFMNKNYITTEHTKYTLWLCRSRNEAINTKSSFKSEWILMPFFSDYISNLPCLKTIRKKQRLNQHSPSQGNTSRKYLFFVICSDQALNTAFSLKKKKNLALSIWYTWSSIAEEKMI